MSRRRKGPILYSVTLPPHTYAKIYAIAVQARRDPEDIIDLAINLFAAATKTIHHMHYPADTPTPQPKQQRAQAEARTARAIRKPTTVGAILKDIAAKERNQRR